MNSGLVSDKQNQEVKTRNLTHRYTGQDSNTFVFIQALGLLLQFSWALTVFLLFDRQAISTHVLS